MIERVPVERRICLDDYAGFVPLAVAVGELRSRARELVPRIAGRRVWLVSSTAAGGGVAEMLPQLISILRELGVTVEWVVIRPREPEFFVLTKRLHNLIHGVGDPRLGASDHTLYRTVSRQCAEELAQLIDRDDLLVVHDPQPLGVGAELKRAVGVRAIWRSHIGLEEELPATRAVWEFLRPFTEAYDHAVFSAREYVPDWLLARTTIIAPGIDPLGHKNRELKPHKLVGILCDSRLSQAHAPVLTPPFAEPARRLRPDGRFTEAAETDEIGLLYRPILTQISRWDRLKGFLPLLSGFVELKRRARTGERPARDRRRLEIARLVLAGPDPGGVADDPEARAVLEELGAAWRALEPPIRDDIALVTLPMGSRKENALMVNALQRSSVVVIQNSLREGFGLTATEAMWKGVAVLASCATGLRLQVRDQLDGRLVRDPLDAAELARTLDEMLSAPHRRAAWGRSGQRRVLDEFLVFSQAMKWLRVFAETAARR